MDPNALSNLDPKLRETYERVMGAKAPASPQGDPAAPTSPTPMSTEATTQNQASPTTPIAPVMETPFAKEDKPEAVTISQPLPNPAPMTPLAKSQGHAGLLRVLYILGAIVFFTVYVYFWAIIFKFKLPFLG